MTSTVTYVHYEDGTIEYIHYSGVALVVFWVALVDMYTILAYLICVALRYVHYFGTEMVLRVALWVCTLLWVHCEPVGAYPPPLASRRFEAKLTD